MKRRILVAPPAIPPPFPSMIAGLTIKQIIEITDTGTAKNLITLLLKYEADIASITKLAIKAIELPPTDAENAIVAIAGAIVIISALVSSDIFFKEYPIEEIIPPNNTQTISTITVVEIPKPSTANAANAATQH